MAHGKGATGFIIMTELKQSGQAVDTQALSECWWAEMTVHPSQKSR